MAKVISISNQKGGVGKTTTAVNLAASLGVAEHKTLLVDLDAQGNATSGVGLIKSDLESTIYEVLMGDEDIVEVIQPTAIPALSVLPANQDLIGFEIESVQRERREFILKDRLQEVTSSYEFVIIDCPPSLGLLTLNALSASDTVLVPLQCEYYALEGLTALLHTIELVKRSLNPNLTVEGIVLTMFDGRNNLSKQVASDVNTHFKDLVFETLIPRNVRLSESPSHGKPILLYDVHCQGAKSYFKLTKELLAKQIVSRETMLEARKEL